MMQHLAYQPLLPAGSKYLQQKWDQFSYDLHKRKVRTAKSTINTTPPKTYGHLALKLKKLKLEEEWTMKIQRENSMLTDKISHIMRTTGGVDNRNDYDRKSLGKKKRQLELLRITKENQVILLHLSQCKSHYNVRSWHEDWLQTLKVMDAIARYPRGANQQKGQENCCKKSDKCDKGKKTSADETTHGPANNKTDAKAKSKENKSRKETIRKEDTGTEQEETTTHPRPNVPEDPGSSDTIQSTPDERLHTAEMSLAPDVKSEISNTPHTPKTQQQEG